MHCRRASLSSISGFTVNDSSVGARDDSRDVSGVFGILAVSQPCPVAGPALASTAARPNAGASSSPGSLWLSTLSAGL